MFAEEGSLESWEQGRRKEVESAWPEYSAKTELFETPAYTLEAPEGNHHSGHSGATPRQSVLKTRLERGRA